MITAEVNCEYTIKAVFPQMAEGQEMSLQESMAEKSRLASVSSLPELSAGSGEPSLNLAAFQVTAEQEYETQFFGFTPKSFCDGCKF